MTLTTGTLHQPYVVVSTQAEPSMMRRLCSFGIRRGAQVKLIRRLAGGGGVLAVAGARVALDPSVLESLTVAPAA